MSLNKIKYFSILISVINVPLSLFVNAISTIQFFKEEHQEWLNIVAWYLILSIIFLSILWHCHGYYSRWRLRQVLSYNYKGGILKKFEGSTKLDFVYATNTDQIEELEKTENYGNRGDTNLPQVISWWGKYEHGNILAIYNEKIIGGIDIWPINKFFYSLLFLGKAGEENLTPKYILNKTDVQNITQGSCWYIASLSLAMIYRLSRTRYEIIIRLICRAFEKWLEVVPGGAFPAHFIASSWTVEGKNFLMNNGFELITEEKIQNFKNSLSNEEKGNLLSYNENHNNDSCYYRVFNDKVSIETFINNKFKKRLGKIENY